MRRILICGDRNWTDRAVIRAFLEHRAEQGIVVVHGAARGADTIAGEEAEGLGFQVEAYPADWEKYGKKAGPIRNLQMLDTKPDEVWAFHDNLALSKGTAHTVREAARRGIFTMTYAHPGSSDSETGDTK